MKSLKVVGNKIIKSDGNELLIKCICINSPGILISENHDYLNDIKEIKKITLVD